MATKVDAPAAKPKPGAEGDQDLAILNPQQTITIAGRTITVREYGFVEGLHLRPLTQPILDALYELFANSGTPPELEDILAVLAAHAEALVTLMSRAADVDECWVAGLGQDDGYALTMVWWSVNGPFFIRRVFDRKAARRAVENLRAGQMSTPPSSPPDTETEPSTASDA